MPPPLSDDQRFLKWLILSKTLFDFHVKNRKRQSEMQRKDENVAMYAFVGRKKYFKFKIF